MKFSRAYMKSTEFKTRQLWLDFKDVVGTVLEVLEPVKEAAWTWFKKWQRNFRTRVMETKINNQMVFPFYQMKGAT